MEFGHPLLEQTQVLELEGRVGWHFGDFQPHREPEIAALPDDTSNPRRATHLFGEQPRDREAQAGAAGASAECGVAHLESIEEPGLDLGRHAATRVDDVELQPDPGVLLLLDADPHQHLAVLRELDGVRDQVEQRLPDPDGIADDAGRQGGNGRSQRDPVDPRLLLHHGRHVDDDLADVDRTFAQLEPSGVDRGDVEDALDEVDQVLAGDIEATDPIGLLRAQRL